jgi:hypothetical protein
VHDLDPDARDESALSGAREGHLVELVAAAGLHDPEPSTLTVTVPFATFTEWWEPYTLGVGPAGAYVAGLDQARRAALAERCEQRLPAAPLEIAATAWCVRARA